MKKRKSKPDSAGDRRRAETRLRRQKTEKVTPASGGHGAAGARVAGPPDRTGDAERGTQPGPAEVEAGLERYTELYDFAPAGYFTLDPDGKIRQAKIYTGASLLGLERARLVRFGLGRFVAPDDSNQWGQYLQEYRAVGHEADLRIEVHSCGRLASRSGPNWRASAWPAPAGKPTTKQPRRSAWRSATSPSAGKSVTLNRSCCSCASIRAKRISSNHSRNTSPKAWTWTLSA